jgi:hypothetical protein
MIRKYLTLAAVATVLLAATLPAAANMILSVKCTAGQASAVQEFEILCNEGIADWTLPGPVSIMAGDMLLGRITDLSIQTDVEPYVNLRFAVEAGATDTTFDITSAVVSFDPLLRPDAYASAGVTLTSDNNGATITGLLSGMNYQARYNGGSVYASLVAGFLIPGDQTVVSTDRKPAAGPETIFATVSSIQSEFHFTLSALDQASGTSRFEVVPSLVPEPATLSLLALGGLALVRRRN